MKGEGSSCALRFLEPHALDKSFGDFPLRTWPRSCFLSSLLDTLLGGARRRSLSYRTPPPKQQKGDGRGASSSTTSKPDETGYADLRDSYVPLFSGQPADYKEWRQRIQLNVGDDPMGTIPQDEMEEYVPTSPEPEGDEEVEEIETPEEYETETPEHNENENQETQDHEEHDGTGDQDNLTASEPEEEFCEDETGDIGVFKAGERKKIQGNLTEILQAEPERPSVVEVFCPGRFAERAGDFGLKVIGSSRHRVAHCPGFRTRPHHGKGRILNNMNEM